MSSGFDPTFNVLVFFIGAAITALAIWLGELLLKDVPVNTAK